MSTPGRQREDEIQNLIDAFELGEIPIPRPPQNIAKFETYVQELRNELKQAWKALKKCRDANPLGVMQKGNLLLRLRDF